MKVDLIDATLFGEWSSEDELAYDVSSWFEKSSFQFFTTDKLIENFGYKNYNEIESCGHFIPVFKTDVVALKKEFVTNLRSKEVENEIQAIIERKNRGYDVAFRIWGEEHPTLWGEYHEFERDRLLRDAEKWCKYNSIPYYTPYDEELCIDLNTVYFWSGYDLLEPLSEPLMWFAKSNFHFVDLPDLKVNYGYKNCDDILASGEFVPLFKRNLLELQKKFIVSFNNKALEEELELIFKQNKDYSYEDAFYTLIADKELNDVWDCCEKNQGLEMAKQWCIDNNIPYYFSKDRPDHLGSQLKDKTGDGSVS
ncbi:MAG: hypothetical protein IJF57_03910 [Clostridia bacterium]|nr:hypothetical protein [Clostridia bacterium]